MSSENSGGIISLAVNNTNLQFGIFIIATPHWAGRFASTITTNLTKLAEIAKQGSYPG